MSEKLYRPDLDECRAHNPTVGDYWNEMLCPVLVVVKVTPTEVGYIDRRVDNEDGTWSWDTRPENLKQVTRQEFVELLSYKTQPGFYATCFGERHKWIVDEIEERTA